LRSNESNRHPNPLALLAVFFRQLLSITHTSASRAINRPILENPCGQDVTGGVESPIAKAAGTSTAELPQQTKIAEWAATSINQARIVLQELRLPHRHFPVAS
jgi:hypothetical protein